jgi:hypothetical protein
VILGTIRANLVLLLVLLLLMSTTHGFWRRRRFLRVYVSPVTRELACVVALLLKDPIDGAGNGIIAITRHPARVGLVWHEQDR